MYVGKSDNFGSILNAFTINFSGESLRSSHLMSSYFCFQTSHISDDAPNVATLTL